MKKIFLFTLVIIMVFSSFLFLQNEKVAAADDNEEWLEVSDFETFQKAMCAAGTQKIKLVSNIERSYDPGESDFEYEIIMFGKKVIDLNGYEILYNDNSNADDYVTEGIAYGAMSVEANCRSTFIKVSKGAELTIKDTKGGGKIRTTAYFIGNCFFGMGNYWDFYLYHCYRDAIYVEGKLTVESGQIEAGASKSQYFDQMNLTVDRKQRSIGVTAYEVIRGTAVTVCNGGEFISLGGRYDGHLTPAVKLLGGSRTYWYNGTVCAQCGANCFDVSNSANLTVWSGKFETYYHQYIRDLDDIIGADSDATFEEFKNIVQTMRSTGYSGMTKRPFFHRINTDDYGIIGVPADSIVKGSTVVQNMKDEYDPNFKGNTTVTAANPIADTKITFDATGKTQGAYKPGSSCKITASCPTYFTYAENEDGHAKTYFWSVYDCSTKQYMELATNDGQTYTTTLGTIELADLLGNVKAELKEGVAYRVFCSIQESYKGTDSDPIVHAPELFAQFTVHKNFVIDNFTVTGNIQENSTLSQTGPVFVEKKEGIKDINFIYEKNGTTLKDGTKATYGNYDCCVMLTAKDGYEFSTSTTINCNGEIFIPDTVSKDGKTCWFSLPTVHIDCTHGDDRWQHDDTKHWKVCSICGEKYNESVHNFTETVSGSKATYTCEDCGFEKTGKVAETRTAARYVSINIGKAFVGGEKPESVSLEYMTDTDNNKYYDFATVQSVEWSGSGKKFTNETSYVTIGIKAKENYYFSKITLPIAGFQYVREEYGTSDGETLYVTFSFTPYSYAEVSVDMPLFVAGTTYEEAIENTVVKVNGKEIDDFGIALTIDGESTLVGSVNDGEVAESYFNKKISLNAEIKYEVSVYDNKTYYKDIKLTDYFECVISDIWAGETIAYIEGRFTATYNEMSIAAISHVTFPTIGDDIETEASAGGSQTMKKSLSKAIHYKVESIKYDATGKFTCGKKYTVTAILKALDGYRFSKTDNMQNVSINGQKVEKYSVSNDGLTLTMSYIFDEIEHDVEITKTPATCDKAGSLVSICKNCKEIISTETIPATGHEYNECAEVKATCTDTGIKKHYECAECGKIFDESKKETTAENIVLPVDKTNHVGGETECDDNGHYTLCACGEKLNNAAHSFGQWTVLSEATEEQKGTVVYYCASCVYTKVEEFDVGEEPEETQAADETEQPKSSEAPENSEKPESTKAPDGGKNETTKVETWVWIVVALSAAAVVSATVICVVLKKKKA